MIRGICKSCIWRYDCEEARQGVDIGDCFQYEEKSSTSLQDIAQDFSVLDDYFECMKGVVIDAGEMQERLYEIQKWFEEKASIN